MDKVFTHPIKKQFEFDEDVATVFDDMLERSIPFYKEVLELVCNLAILNSEEKSQIVDLGCSTANTLLNIYKKSKGRTLIGVDNSQPMLENASKKIRAFAADIKLVQEDITQYDLQGSDVVLANYMLQFIRPLEREKFVKKIYDSLNEKGVFLLSEKIIFEDKTLNKQMIDLYYDFKRSNGYSDFEISQKREALENVLVPYTKDENITMLKNAGFKSVQSIFQYGNFITLLARKAQN
jgi:tRNA (cmo5U34)-methyltransferase